MARTPNYGHERREREKNKAAKRAARAEAKKAKADERQTPESEQEGIDPAPVTEETSDQG